MVEERLQLLEDNQLARRMGTTTKGAIPSTIREGGFAVVDGRRNLGTTTENCAVERLKESIATKRRSYITR
jgi:hypothetical protein